MSFTSQYGCSHFSPFSGWFRWRLTSIENIFLSHCTLRQKGTTIAFDACPNLSHNPIHLPWRLPHRPSSRTRFRFPGNRSIINMGISPLACHSVDPSLARFSKQAQWGSFYYSRTRLGFLPHFVRKGSDGSMECSSRILFLFQPQNKPSPPLPIDLIDQASTNP